MRRKNQRERRAQLADAARDVLLQRGAIGLRVKDIAERAGMSPSTVLYYYPEIEDLLLEVSRAATDRFAETRARAVRELADPLEQLRLAIRLGVPTGPDDDESRLLYELDALTGASTAFAALSTAYFDRQAALYEAVLAAGAAAGQFDLAEPLDLAARGLVALEDGLGLQVVLGHPSIDSAEAERVLLAYAAAMVGAALPAA
ncbi:MAG: TetR/AcrR family transcriptional regulator [Solirubrobacterales bacterium]